MPLPIPSAFAVRALAALAVAAVGFLAGWTVHGWRSDAETERLRAGHAEEAAGRVTRALDTLKTAQAQRDALAAQLATVDAAGTAALRKVQDENETLRGAVAAGALRVRVNAARCPRAADVPQAPAGSGVDSGAGAELDAQGRQDFLDLRAAAGRTDAKLAACQHSLRSLTGQ